jgi:hypothetical protein
MPRRRVRENERYGGPRERSAYAAHQWRRDQNGTPRKTVDDNPGSDGEEAKNEKGGTAGANFGRNAYNQGSSK